MNNGQQKQMVEALKRNNEVVVKPVVLDYLEAGFRKSLETMCGLLECAPSETIVVEEGDGSKIFILETGDIFG